MDISARQVQKQTFKTSFRGYSPTEVRTYLDSVGAHISSLDEQLAIAGAKANRCQEQLDRIDSQLESKILEAKQARDAIIEEARREASVIIEGGGSADRDASRTAAAIISEAEAKANLRLREIDEIKSEARKEADRVTAEAERAAALRMAEADRVLENAKREARTIHKESEKRRTELEARLSHLGRALAAAESEGVAADAHVTVTSDGELLIDLTSGADVSHPG